jgi:hypothetical protein
LRLGASKGFGGKQLTNPPAPLPEMPLARGGKSGTPGQGWARGLGVRRSRVAAETRNDRTNYLKAVSIYIGIIQMGRLAAETIAGRTMEGSRLLGNHFVWVEGRRCDGVPAEPGIKSKARWRSEVAASGTEIPQLRRPDSVELIGGWGVLSGGGGLCFAMGAGPGLSLAGNTARAAVRPLCRLECRLRRGPVEKWSSSQGLWELLGRRAHTQGECSGICGLWQDSGRSAGFCGWWGWLR